MNNIFFIKAVEGNFSYNRSLNYDSKGFTKDIEVGVKSVMNFMDKDQIIINTTYVKYKKEDEDILSYEVSFLFKINEWPKDIKFTEEDLKNQELTKTITNISIGYIRGSLAMQAKNTPVAAYYLPILSIDDVVRNSTINAHNA